MCTVTFVPANGKVFITHNRDEKRIRTKAIPPATYTINGIELLFPRDTAAGGTWVALQQNGDAAVLLNGGFVKHIPAAAYRKSRGVVFLEIFASADALRAYRLARLDSIEPFTLILWCNAQLFECRWDGADKHIQQLDEHAKHTWSSVTLYDAGIIARRKAWFLNWQTEHPLPSIEDIIAFHLTGGDGDLHNDLRMNRDNQMLTVSITAMTISTDSGYMKYLDLQDNLTFEQQIDFVKHPAVNYP